MILARVFFFLFAALAMAAEVDNLVGFSPASPLLVPRAETVDRSCATSVVLKLSPPTPTNSAFFRWATSRQVNIPACSVTAPASLSSDYISYDKVLSTYVSTISSAAKAVKYTCGGSISVSFTNYCSSSRTVFFTDSSKTETVKLPQVTKPGTIMISAAGRSDVPRILALLAAGVVVLALAF